MTARSSRSKRLLLAVLPWRGRLSCRYRWHPGPTGAARHLFGTLWIKSPASMLGYWNNPERTAEVLIDGWVNTGDLLERREDGFFYIKEDPRR